MPRSVAFYQAVLRSLASEGFENRAILRTFAVESEDDAIEVLLIHGSEAETAWVDHEGVLVHGPIPGFGPQGT